MTLRLANPMSAVVWAAFLLAAIFPGAGADRLFGALVCVLGVATLLAMPSPWEAHRPSAAALRFCLALELLYVASAVYSAGVNGASFSAASALELPRFLAVGVFVAYLIRHFDAHVREALDWAAAGALYVFLVLPSADPQAYAAVLCLVWLLFFSRLRLRFLHAATALTVVVLSGEGAARSAAGGALIVGFSLLVYRGLARGRARRSGRWSALICLFLLAGAAALSRAQRVRAPATLAATDAVARQFIRRSPVFGWGPVDGALIVGRSQYVFWTLKQGYLGAGLILAGLALLAFRLLRAAREDATRFAGTAALLASVAWLLTAGRFFESYRLFFLTAFFAAAARAEARS